MGVQVLRSGDPIGACSRSEGGGGTYLVSFANPLQSELGNLAMIYQDLAIPTTSIFPSSGFDENNNTSSQ